MHRYKIKLRTNENIDLNIKNRCSYNLDIHSNSIIHLLLFFLHLVLLESNIIFWQNMVMCEVRVS